MLACFLGCFKAHGRHCQGLSAVPSFCESLRSEVKHAVAAQVADMLEAAVARSHPGEESGQQAEKSGLLPRSLHFPRDPVSAAKKVITSSLLSLHQMAPSSGSVTHMRHFNPLWKCTLLLLVITVLLCPGSHQHHST